MSSMPIVDGESGMLQIQSAGGKDYVKVYNPSLNSTTWKAWSPPSSGEITLLTPLSARGPDRPDQDDATTSNQPAGVDNQPAGFEANDDNAIATSLLLPKVGEMLSPDKEEVVPFEGITSSSLAESEIAEGQAENKDATSALSATVSGAPRSVGSLIIICVVSSCTILTMWWW